MYVCMCNIYLSLGRQKLCMYVCVNIYLYLGRQKLFMDVCVNIYLSLGRQKPGRGRRQEVRRGREEACTGKNYSVSQNTSPDQLL